MGKVVVKALTMLMAFVLCSTAFTMAQTSQTGPFGFEKGMTPAQVIKLVGQPNRVEGDIMSFNRAPKPNDEYESYLLLFSPTAGLLKVVAIGKDVQTGDDGTQLQSAYQDTISGVESKYGAHDADLPTTVCSGNDTECSESRFWMMSLLDKNRTAEAFWVHRTAPYPNGVSLIEVKANATGINTGYITCGFEFVGFEAYADSKKAKQNSNY